MSKRQQLTADAVEAARERALLAASLAGAGVIGLVLVAGAAWFNITSSATQRIEDYRPDYQVSALSPDSISRSQTILEHPTADLILNWSTSDNDVFGRGPYKLRLIMRPKSEQLLAVEFDSISVWSDRTKYSFAESTAWPVRIQLEGDTWTDRIFEPAFPFNYAAAEEVTTQLWYRILTTSEIHTESAEIRWLPIRIEKFVGVA